MQLQSSALFRAGHRRGERLERLLQNSPPDLFLLLWRGIGIPDGMDDAVSGYDAVGAYHLGYRRHSADVHGWNPDALEFIHDRCAAACAGASRASKDDGIHANLYQVLGHLSSHPAAVLDGVS